MKRILLFSLSIFLVLFLSGCSSMGVNNNLVDTWINKKIIQLEQQISWLNLRLNSLKDMNFKLITLLNKKENAIDITTSTRKTYDTGFKSLKNKPQSSNLEFKNSIYWFKLEFPKIWEWYITKIQWNKVIFWFKEQQNLLTITALTHSEWGAMKQDLMWPTYLWENDKYIFVYSIAQDAINKKMINRMSEINGIISTFKMFDR